ncbi:uncharacterized protein [Spinacia oleracea]|uniref:Uncharacterized protein isoform X2 n=1 Tax=Spinacia oleracea TaxID=3562 RepID=A0ABM3QLC6_SPIOL|nr:uncharacterized protein LOC110802369 isoform X2 [Spinacia oleracea]XP_056684168.1 uncharacterized protein LOC110802369 isoform X2 [Spinacia oleracea]XP_056684170.1 uncharacterized protein LOC110802369 isoform X2 [Spinacia oleracea]
MGESWDYSSNSSVYIDFIQQFPKLLRNCSLPPTPFLYGFEPLEFPPYLKNISSIQRAHPQSEASKLTAVSLLWLIGRVLLSLKGNSFGNIFSGSTLITRSSLKTSFILVEFLTSLSSLELEPRRNNVYLWTLLPRIFLRGSQVVRRRRCRSSSAVSRCFHGVFWCDFQGVFRIIDPKHVPEKYGGIPPFDGQHGEIRGGHLDIPRTRRKRVEFHFTKGSKVTVRFKVIGWDVSYGAKFVCTGCLDDELKFQTLPRVIREFGFMRSGWMPYEEFVFGDESDGKIELTIQNRSFSTKKLVYLCRIEEESNAALSKPDPCNQIFLPKR